MDPEENGKTPIGTRILTAFIYVGMTFLIGGFLSVFGWALKTLVDQGRENERLISHIEYQQEQVKNLRKAHGDILLELKAEVDRAHKLL